MQAHEASCSESTDPSACFDPPERWLYDAFNDPRIQSRYRAHFASPGRLNSRSYIILYVHVNNLYTECRLAFFGRSWLRKFH